VLLPRRTNSICSEAQVLARMIAEVSAAVRLSQPDLVGRRIMVATRSDPNANDSSTGARLVRRVSEVA
jgi:hypothetical protein